MAILAECPACHRKQSNKNKFCGCGEALDKAKRSKRVRYWITYRLPGEKQLCEAVGFFVEETRAAEDKRRGQKREGRIFNMLPESKMTFNELAEWYPDLKGVASKMESSTNLTKYSAPMHARDITRRSGYLTH